MEKFDLDKILIGGYSVNLGDVFSKLLVAHSTNSILLSEVLVRLLAIEKHLQVEKESSDIARHEAQKILSIAVNNGSSHLAQIIAELATKNKD